VSEVPVTLETVGVESYSQLYALPTAEVIRRLDEKTVPLHAGDAFLAVLVLRAVADLADATKRLEKATNCLVWLTLVLVVATVIVVASRAS
jgi:hypothetical protein